MLMRLSSVSMLAGVLVLMNAACSVKEDRSMCPCSLSLDLGGECVERNGSVELDVVAADGFLYYGVVQADGNGVLSGLSSSGAVDAGAADAGGRDLQVPGSGAAVFRDGSYIVKIPKGNAGIAVFSGDKGFFSGISGLRIPLGEECPPVLMFTSTVDAGSEKVCEEVSLHKNYCRITIRMLAAGDSYPFDLDISGGIAGYGFDGSLMEGDFLFCTRPDASGVCHVNVPRQKDESLLLRITDEDDVLREFALGEFIAESGYDWTLPDLEDIEVSIDYAMSNVVFRVEDWEASFSFEVVI